MERHSLKVIISDLLSPLILPPSLLLSTPSWCACFLLHGENWSHLQELSLYCHCQNHWGTACEAKSSSFWTDEGGPTARVPFESELSPSPSISCPPLSAQHLPLPLPRITAKGTQNPLDSLSLGKNTTTIKTTPSPRLCTHSSSHPLVPPSESRACGPTFTECGSGSRQPRGGNSSGVRRWKHR